MEQAEQAGSGSAFFLAHIFFLVVFVVLVWAVVVVLRRRPEPTPLLLSTFPLLLIFLTAYLGPRLPGAHQAVNILYDGLLIYNTVYFWKRGPMPLGLLYLTAVIGTVLDFAMHFVIRIA